MRNDYSGRTNRGFRDVTHFGAVGDGATDDTAAIQAAFDAAGPGDRIVIPAGEYAVSRRLRLGTTDTVLQGYGTLVPAAGMEDYLLEIGKGSRAAVDVGRDTIGLRMVVECLRINGLGRSRGVFFNGHYHSTFSNVNVMRTRNCAVKLHDVRESSFNQLNINFCSSYTEEPLLDIAFHFGGNPDPYGGGWQFEDGKTVDGQNCVRFFGANIVHSMAKTFVDIGGDTGDSKFIYYVPARFIHFTGCQFHLSPPQWFRSYGGERQMCESNTPWDVDGIRMIEAQTMVRMRNAVGVTFSQCNFPGSPGKECVAVQLGDATGPASDCSFVACRIRHVPIKADNAKQIKFIGCTLGAADDEVKVSGRDAARILIL
jgi:hypothetical protein